MTSKLWIRKALSLCLSVAILATYSMVALASSGKVAGELLTTGPNASSVTVNGETAKAGRSIFSSSTIITPENANAVINLGKLGKISLAPNSTATLTIDEKGISGDLAAGKLTVLGAANAVAVKTLNGTTVLLNAGETVAANGRAQDDDDDDDDGGMAWWGFAAIFGGAAAIILWTATRDGHADLGGGGTVISPTR
jgi:hypothetical protein